MFAVFLSEFLNNTFLLAKSLESIDEMFVNGTAEADASYKNSLQLRKQKGRLLLPEASHGCILEFLGYIC